MMNFVILLTASLTLLRDVTCITAKTNKPETPTLFIPSISYPALVHLHPSGYNTELLENAASFPRYAYNHDSSEYTDPLQRQLLFQNTDKRLEAIFHSRDDEKSRKPTEFRDDDFDRSANSILFQEELKPEFHDLDRRYKRHVIPAARMPSLPARRTNLRDNDYPFGPVGPTTWKAYPSRDEYVPSGTRVGRANPMPSWPRNERRIRGDDLSYDPNHIRTARPLDAPNDDKAFSAMDIFLPIQTQPLTLSNAKSGPTVSAYTDQLTALMRANFDSKNRKLD